MNKIGARIKELRGAKAMTQEQLAQKLHVTRQAVSSWENGKTQPDIQTLTRLAEALGVSVEEIIYAQPKKKTSIFPERNGDASMFENSGAIIKKAAAVVLYAGCGISIFQGLFTGGGLLVITPIGCLISWFIALLLHGFGQLIENSDKCVEILTAIHGDPAAASEPEAQAPVQPKDPWTCYSCGTVNEQRVAYCIQCGASRDWSKMKQEQ